MSILRAFSTPFCRPAADTKQVLTIRHGRVSGLTQQAVLVGIVDQELLGFAIEVLHFKPGDMRKPILLPFGVEYSG